MKQKTIIFINKNNNAVCLKRATYNGLMIMALEKSLNDPSNIGSLTYR